MTTILSVHEVTEFRTAVTGVEVDWVRLDRGWGPAFMVSSGDRRIAVSSGGLDFSTFMQTEIPDDRVGLQLLTRAPSGMRWCGASVEDGDLFVHGPGSSVIARSPAGTRAVSVIASLEALQQVADDLGVSDLRFPVSTEALPRSPEVAMLDRDLAGVAALPELLEVPSGSTRLLESIVRAIASADHRLRWPVRRGFDSRGIVAACLDYVEQAGDHQPPISQLCRVGYASESRLRRAFLEVLGVPPSQYFQLRVLSMLRDELLSAESGDSTVTSAATSLGLTHLGRVAGRYRAAFGETPSDTLQHRQTRRR